MKEVLCETGKEVYLDIGLREAVIELGEVSVANVSKDQTIPIHKAMKTSGFFHQIHYGTEI